MPAPKLTIAYVTARIDPRFVWFAASLGRELRASAGLAADDIQVIVVDARLWRDEQMRRAELAEAVAGRFPVEHVRVKPSVWQGGHRLTQQEWFCAATARNTAFALARAPHIAFVDDLSVIVPGWLEAHLHAARCGDVLAGLTYKRGNVVVDDDGRYRSDPLPGGDDSRLDLLRDGDYALCAGSRLYGGTFSVPLEAALSVNGQDEIHEGIAGGEDYDFGIRLERFLGKPARICRTCATIEDGPAHHTENDRLAIGRQWIKCVDQWWDLSHPEARDWRREATGWGDVKGVRASDAIKDRLRRESTRVRTVGNDFDLRALREKALSGKFPIPTEPTRRWVDGAPLTEIRA
jgi:hypothetical protein